VCTVASRAGTRACSSRVATRVSRPSLFATAIEAGVFRVDLELRAGNEGARSFYQRLGFESATVVQGYYQGREAALKMTKRLP
jgi:ribosomal protein S18 acetylase RimI-like enzyme